MLYIFMWKPIFSEMSASKTISSVVIYLLNNYVHIVHRAKIERRGMPVRLLMRGATISIKILLTPPGALFSLCGTKIYFETISP